MGRDLKRRLAASLVLVAVISLLLSGCETKSSRRPTRYPPGQPPAGQYPPGQTPPPGQPTPGQPAPSSTAPPLSHPPVFDPINNVEIPWLRNRAQEIIRELVAALPAGPQGRVSGIPLIVDDTVGEVNAFASCTKNGKAAMAITDGLLDIEAHLAQAKATDETFGSRKTDEYIRYLATHQRSGEPVVRPPLGFFEPTEHLDPHKVGRQHQLFDEQVAFVLGHELAHHYLGHLPCTAPGGALSPSEIGMVLSSAVPLFNQPNEMAADTWGTYNLLGAGARRQGYKLTEGGAMLTMQFFAGMDQFSAIDILFAFERSHPPPMIRTPWIQQTANAWRFTGGRTPPLL